MVPAKGANNNFIKSKNGITKEKQDNSSSVFEILIEELFDTSINIPDCIEQKIADFESTKKGSKNSVIITFFRPKSILGFTSFNAFFHSSSIKNKLFQEASLLVEKGYGYIFRLTPF
jgi:hypothetical protein